jgi:hypothetical protein
MRVHDGLSTTTSTRLASLQPIPRLLVGVQVTREEIVRAVSELMGGGEEADERRKAKEQSDFTGRKLTGPWRREGRPMKT